MPLGHELLNCMRPHLTLVQGHSYFLYTENTSYIHCHVITSTLVFSSHASPSIPPWTCMPSSFLSLPFANVRNSCLMQWIVIISPEIYYFITYVIIFHPISYISCLSLYISMSISFILYHISLSRIFSQWTSPSHSPLLNFCYKPKSWAWLYFIMPVAIKEKKPMTLKELY